MRHIYQGTFKDQNGAVVGSSTTSDGNPGTVTVYLAGADTLASVYAADLGGVAVNSVSTDAYGYFYFWVDDSDYAFGQLFKIVLTHADFLTRSYDNIMVIEPTATSIAAIVAASNTFLQAGTGAVSRTPQNKMRERVSVLDFMTDAQVADVASGAETLDVVVPIQAAIDYLNSKGGGELYFPEGVYYLTATHATDTSSHLALRACHSVILVGDGPNASVLKPSTTDKAVIGVSVGSDNCGIKAMRLDRDATAVNGGHGIQFHTAATNPNFYAENVYITKQYHGVHASTARPQGSVWFGCFFNLNTADGVNLIMNNEERFYGCIANQKYR